MRGTEGEMKGREVLCNSLLDHELLKGSAFDLVLCHL